MTVEWFLHLAEMTPVTQQHGRQGCLVRLTETRRRKGDVTGQGGNRNFSAKGEGGTELSVQAAQQNGVDNEKGYDATATAHEVPHGG